MSIVENRPFHKRALLRPTKSGVDECYDSINNVGSRGPSRLWRRKPTKGLGGKEPNMLIIGCDYHPGLQQIAWVDTETGECGERRLTHREEAEQFYQSLKQRNAAVRVGMESS